jgi:hypothetical protein
MGSDTDKSFERVDAGKPPPPQHRRRQREPRRLLVIATLLRALQEDAHFIRDMLTPRALELATDTRLVELFIGLETAERSGPRACVSR